MAVKKHDHFARTEDFIGQLYGRLFGRDADHEGYTYWVTAISEGNITPLAAFEDFLCSEEFAEKRLVNDTPNQISRKLLRLTLGERAATKVMIKEIALSFCEFGLRKTVSRLTIDPIFELDRDGFPSVGTYE